MFFVLSGFVYKEYEMVVFLKKKIHSLLIPVVFFSVLYTLYKIIVVQEKISWISVLLCKSNSYIHLYWFIWALLWTESIFFILKKIIKNNYFVLLFSIIILILLMFLNCEKILLNLPFCIGNVPYLLPFYAIGVCCKDTKFYNVSYCKLGLLFSIDIFICWKYMYGISYALLSFDNLLLDYIKAGIGISFFVLASKAIDTNKIKFVSSCLQKIGKESLWIYLVHGFFFWGLFKKLLCFIPQNEVIILIYILIASAVTIAIIYIEIIIYRIILERFIFNVLQSEK